MDKHVQGSKLYDTSTVLLKSSGNMVVAYSLDVYKFGITHLSHMQGSVSSVPGGMPNLVAICTGCMGCVLEEL